MTDPTPNNLPGPEPLSPAAQAIVQAFDDRYELLGPLEDDWQEQCLAAALRAVADEVVPDMDEPESGAYNEMHCDIELFTDHQRKRATIIAIATELEDHQ